MAFKYIKFEERVKTTEKLLKKEIKSFRSLYKKNYKDVDIIFDPINLSYRHRICEQAVDFMMFKPKSSHEEYENLVYWIRFIVQIGISETNPEAIQDKFAKMYQLFQILAQGDVPEVGDNKEIANIYIK